MTLARALPEHHLTEDSKKAIERGLAIIGTVAGLVLGLLVASATGAYNAQRGYVIQLSSQIALLDRALAHYGPEAQPERARLRLTAQRVLSEIWPQPGAPAGASAPGNRQNEALFDQLEALAPKNAEQTSLKGIAISMALDLGRTRWLIYEQLASSISMPLLIMLIFWFCVTFCGIGLFAPRNATTLVGLALCAVAITGAIFLMLEMYSPFEGLIQIPSTPLQDTISRLGT
ncbi:MAG: hypothetical protein JO029_06265 [Candidatus Eremiobacteraeota bacterium]|nr:hypothetical protein [Candidatus Eremiobacteraeota bacterium]